jgi:hypothetical protein
MIKIKDRIKRLRRGADYENYYTALDIGTEYIKALVVKREGRNGVVLGASRHRQEFADMQAGVPPTSRGSSIAATGRCQRPRTCAIRSQARQLSGSPAS